MRIAVFGSRLEEKNHYWENIEKALSKYNVQVDTTYFSSSLEEERRNPQLAYDKLKKILQKADAVVVENTNYSTGIGLIIGRIIELGKPMLIIFDRNSTASESPSILVKAHSKDRKSIFREYGSTDELEQMLADFIKQAKELLNTKFLFNLSPEMAKYLQWGSETYNRPMVDILRELISERMDTDKVWEKYQAEEK